MTSRPSSRPPTRSNIRLSNDITPRNHETKSSEPRKNKRNNNNNNNLLQQITMLYEKEKKESIHLDLTKQNLNRLVNQNLNQIKQQQLNKKTNNKIEENNKNHNRLKSQIEDLQNKISSLRKEYKIYADDLSISSLEIINLKKQIQNINHIYRRKQVSHVKICEEYRSVEEDWKNASNLLLESRSKLSNYLFKRNKLHDNKSEPPIQVNNVEQAIVNNVEQTGSSIFRRRSMVEINSPPILSENKPSIYSLTDSSKSESEQIDEMVLKNAKLKILSKILTEQISMNKVRNDLENKLVLDVLEGIENYNIKKDYHCDISSDNHYTDYSSKSETIHNAINSGTMKKNITSHSNISSDNHNTDYSTENKYSHNSSSKSDDAHSNFTGETISINRRLSLLRKQVVNQHGKLLSRFHLNEVRPVIFKPNLTENHEDDISVEKQIDDTCISRINTLNLHNRLSSIVEKIGLNSHWDDFEIGDHHFSIHTLENIFMRTMTDFAENHVDSSSIHDLWKVEDHIEESKGIYIVPRLFLPSEEIKPIIANSEDMMDTSRKCISLSNLSTSRSVDSVKYNVKEGRLVEFVDC